MLQTTPESLHEKLPMLDKTGNLAITADARIDNRDELISSLNLNGRPKETITDSELILAAYEKWEETCPEKLLGDFSFAIWDAEKKKVFCARDPVGIKPFYYHFDEKTFRWASEPKAIFGDRVISKEPNLSLVCRCLKNQFDEPEETLYRNVYRLPPSYFMEAGMEGLHKKQYWDIDPALEIRYRTNEEYVEHFLDLFEDAVRSCMRNYGPSGALLSGGLDSSSIVCIAKKLSQRGRLPENGFETFSMIYDNLPCDERPYIDEIVTQCEFKSNYFNFEDILPWLDLDQSKKYSDVLYLPTLYDFAPLLEKAQQNGIRVMLDGLGGDDLFAPGYNHLADYFRRGSIYKCLMQLYWDTKISSYSSASLFLNYCLVPVIPRPIKKMLKPLVNLFRKNGIPSWINKSVIQGIEQNQDDTPPCYSRKFPTYSQQRIYDGLRLGWNNNFALDSFERFASYFSMEIRHPFFNRHLIEFLIAVPEEKRWYHEYPKILLREATKGVIPDYVRMRKDKAEFSPEIDAEFKERQAERINNLIETSTLCDLGVIDRDKLWQWFRDYRHNTANDNHGRRSIETFIWLELRYRSATGQF